MLRPEKMTVKTQEAYRAAVGLAEKSFHGELTPLHLVHALVDQAEGLVRPLLRAWVRWEPRW